MLAHRRNESLRIAQVDPSRLLARQEIDLYLGVTDDDGTVPADLALDDILIEESTNGSDFHSVEPLDVTPVSELTQGITFLLLIDNSGSMYDTMSGRQTEEPSEMRITAATEAVRTFLRQLDSSRDRVALASFNTTYTLHSPPTAAPDDAERALEAIRRPDAEDAYTELYRAVTLAAADLEGIAGRKVIVILSDGENFPFAVHAGRPHPVYGEETLPPDAAVDAIQAHSAGAFAINFATAGDEGLAETVSASGGLVFDAGDPDQLVAVYDGIRRRILEEFRVTYRPDVHLSQQRWVRVTLTDRPEAPAAERSYFAATLMGLPGRLPLWIYFVALLLAATLAAVTALMRFHNNRTTPNLEVLGAGGQKTQALDIRGQRTVIGSGTKADVTLANAPSLKESHATIVFDERTRAYTVVSDDPITVNNQVTSKRKLAPGDVIKLPGSTIVFDEPEET